MDISIPHTLGQAEARRRIEAGLPKLAAHIPGGGKLDSQWQGNDLALTITALGSTIPVSLQVLEDRIVGTVEVPLFLKAMQSQIGDFVKTSATRMLTAG